LPTRCYVVTITNDPFHPTLKGFVKVFIHAGEVKTVTIKLPIHSTGLHNRKLQYAVEKGQCLVSVGTNSAETIFKALLIV